MEVLIFFLVIIGIVIVGHVVSWLIEFFGNAKLSYHFSEDIENLSERLDRMKITDMSKELPIVKHNAISSMGSIVEPDGKIINICSKCGNAMQADRFYSGIHIHCTKQGCYNFISMNVADDNFNKLRVI